MTQARTYNYKDSEMLMACKIVATTLNTQLSDLSIVRSNWTPEYVIELQGNIDNAIDQFLGLDKKKALRDATAILSAIQGPAMRELQFLKTQIKVDFSSDANEILKTLGYTKYLKAARTGDQEAQIQLLFAFKKGMDNKLKKAIAANGTNPALINRIINYATQLSEANTEQESLKGSTKSLSETAITTLNQIYTEIIGICKIASAYYMYDEILKAQFTFSRVIANMNAAGKTKGQADEDVD